MPASHSTQDMRMRAADLSACRDLLRRGSKSFYLAARLLPARVRDDATALYAFCRVADDAVDIGEQPADALAVLVERLDAIYAGMPADNPVDRAMAVVVARHEMPYALPSALLDGLAWDVAGHDYADIADVRGYGARVAGSVGVMMAWLMGLRDADTLARACELGIAMQLTNIARDVGEDARNGRVYLPKAWLVEARVPADCLSRSPVWHSRLAPVIERLLDRADEHYRYAMPGIARLPARCRPGVRAAALVYQAIGQQVRTHGFDAVTRRAVVPASRKWQLLARALWAPAQPRASVRQRWAPARDEMAFMIEPAVSQARYLARHRSRTHSVASVSIAQLHWWQLGARWLWVCELLASLEERRALDNARIAESNESSSSTATHER